MKVMTPKPRNAKNVRATLAMISRTPGYPAGASRAGFQLAIVTMAKTVRMREHDRSRSRTALARPRSSPTALSAVITSTSRTANTFAQVGSSSATTELA